MKLVRKVYYSLFAGVINSYMKRHSGNDDPKFDDLTIAIIILTCTVYCNILTIIKFVDVVVFKISKSPLFGLPLAILILIVNLVLFVPKKRFIYIYQHYYSENSEESKKQIRKYCAVYVIASYLALLVVPIIQFIQK